MDQEPQTSLSDRLAVRCAGTGEATYWDIEDIQFHCRLSRTTAWQLARRDKDFPQPVVLAPKTIVWPRVEVIAYMEARRKAEHYKPAASPPNPVPDEGGAFFVSRPVRTRRRSSRTGA